MGSFENLYYKIISEAVDDSQKPPRMIDTGLTGNKNKEILSSVIGQLSDGMWENSPRMDKYWRFVDVKDKGGKIYLAISAKMAHHEPRTRYFNGRYIDNGFLNMSDTKIKEWFANKLKAVIKEEGLKWERNSDQGTSYIGYKENITVGDAYAAYDKLKGRKDRSNPAPDASKSEPEKE